MDLTDKMDISLTPKKRRIETKLEGMDQSIVVVTSITDLNTKCLVNIFSLLKLSDLASMAMTCKSFNRVARKVFAKEHQEKLLEIDVKDSLVKSVEILRCFQNQIKKLSICYISNVKVNPKIDVFVNKYCGESLTEMRFKEVGLYSSVRAYIKPFSNVTSLVIQSGIISGKLAEIVTLFPSVTSLEIHGGVQHGGIKWVSNFNWYIRFDFFILGIRLFRDNAAIPSLRHLTISFNPDLGLDHFKKVLVKSNPQLTSLDIHYVGEATTAHLLFLRDSLPNLQRLMLTLTNICVNKEPFKPLLFKELRFLRISCQDSVVLKSIIIKSIHSLERLELSVEGNINVHCVNFIMRHQSKGNWAIFHKVMANY